MATALQAIQAKPVSEQQQLCTKLLNRLRENMCMFKFIKKNGEERIALGTLNPSNYTYEFKGTDRRECWYLNRYWDINKNAWRCFDFRRIVEIYW